MEKLFDAVGGEKIAARELKATTGWSQNGTDSYKFGVIPAGRRNDYGRYDDENIAHYWVPDQQDKSSAFVQDFTYAQFMMDDHFFKNNSFSVRCVSNSSDIEFLDDFSSSSVSSEEILSSSSQNTSSSSINSSSSSLNSSSSVKVYNYEYIEDSRDGKKYKVMKFGNRRWMAENLALDYQNANKSGTQIEKSDSVEFYGRPYLWSEVVDSAGVYSKEAAGCGYYRKKCHLCGVTGICPAGWHVPSINEWMDLFETSSAEDLEVFIVKRNNSIGRFWTSTEYDHGDAYIFYPEENHNYRLNHNDESFALYVRCVENDFSMDEVACKLEWPKEDADKGSVFDADKMILKDERDGNVYRTTKIGNQIWMAENLRYAYLQPTTVTDSSSFCPQHWGANCQKYGRLYFWSAAMDSVGVFSNDAVGCGYASENCEPKELARGVCPEGWHIPSSEEWNILIENVGGVRNAGSNLKSTNGWAEGRAVAYRSQLKDSFGFRALPVGVLDYRQSDVFSNYGYSAAFVSSTVVDKNTAQYVQIHYTINDIRIKNFATRTAFSVRCLKN